MCSNPGPSEGLWERLLALRSDRPPFLLLPVGTEQDINRLPAPLSVPCAPVPCCRSGRLMQNHASFCYDPRSRPASSQSHLADIIKQSPRHLRPPQESQSPQLPGIGPLAGSETDGPGGGGERVKTTGCGGVGGTTTLMGHSGRRERPGLTVAHSESPAPLSLSPSNSSMRVALAETKHLPSPV
ncbi:hypothetical protein AAFF_G00252190 [Aldrovandia affinis]|uniref:Uncharacterized protein n=1 Tax=Aldrovandia affinis TaxID=143900 RepID=A0AAD7WUC1_9TELE|nr:hypothetical protein AAFF_G00252190 [Aldrovandia affinis]